MPSPRDKPTLRPPHPRIPPTLTERESGAPTTPLPESGPDREKWLRELRAVEERAREEQREAQARHDRAIATLTETLEGRIREQQETIARQQATIRELSRLAAAAADADADLELKLANHTRQITALAEVRERETVEASKVAGSKAGAKWAAVVAALGILAEIVRALVGVHAPAPAPAAEKPAALAPAPKHGPGYGGRD